MTERQNDRLDAVFSLLPDRIAVAFYRVQPCDTVEEIRLRTAKQPQIVTSKGEFLLECGAFTRREAEELLTRICRHSVYSHEEELRRGFVALDGGVRVGVCGRPVVSGGRIERMTDITCFNFRITREAVGCAENVIRYVSDRGRPVSSLIVSPPGGGKTTLLRDIARCFSCGIGVPPVKVCLADERGELAGCAGGEPSFDVGPRTDVMELAPKSEAIRIFVRTMSPELIITDEIGDPCDAAALSEATRCGVAVIASAHAGSAEELSKRAELKEAAGSGAFRRILMLRRSGSLLHICPIEL